MCTHDLVGYKPTLMLISGLVFSCFHETSPHIQNSWATIYCMKDAELLGEICSLPPEKEDSMIFFGYKLKKGVILVAEISFDIITNIACYISGHCYTNISIKTM